MPNLRSSVRVLAGAAAALIALVATPASAQLITLGDATNPTPGAPVCPGGGFVQVNAFSLSFPTSAPVTGVRLGFNPGGSYQLVDRIEIRNGGTVLGYVVPTSDYPVVKFTTALTIGPTAVSVPPAATLGVFARIKDQKFMPPPGAGKLISFGIGVDSAISMYGTTGGDATALMPINNATPPDLVWSTVSTTATSITATWKGPARDVLVLRQRGGPVTAVPEEGLTYAATPGAKLGADDIVYSSAVGTTMLDTIGATGTGKPFFYKAFVRDNCGNFSKGASLGPVFPGGVVEGATSGTGPVVGILNPVDGAVTPPFKVQVRVFSPNGAISSPVVELDDGVAPTPISVSLTRNNNYGVAADNGVFEATVNTPTITAGKYYTLRAKATNATGTLWSGPVGVQVSTTKGDGHLLRRDNSSQLCDDCHGANLKTHGSDTTGTKYGTWYVGCRGCHTPHSTTNAALVATEITPPKVRGQFPPAKVVFSTRTGFDPEGGATNGASIAKGTYANGDRTGPCQVCHTQTGHYRRDGSEPQAHYTGPCVTCHSHTGGFSVTGGCTSCHGDPSHTAFATHAPPADTCGNTTAGAGGNNRVGAHVKHLSAAGGTFTNTAVPCAECHTDPPSGTHPRGGNCSPAPADRAVLVWGNGAKGLRNPWSAAVTPGAYDYAGQTCNGTYCHGNFTNSGVTSSVTWNSTVACGSCHGSAGFGSRPPTAGGHPASTFCGDCHGAGYTQTAVGPAVLGIHADGKLDGGGNNCYGCHGTDRALVANVETTLDRYKSAPPGQATIPGVTNPATQAHLQHTYTPNMSQAKPFICGTCHPDTTALDHKNGVLDMAWSPLARTGGVTPNYTGDVGVPAYSCQTTYCHGGAFPANQRGSNIVPDWRAGPSQATCGSCHGSPPADPKHVSLTSRNWNTGSYCYPCHSSTVTSGGTIDIALGNHVDGVYNTTNVTCTSCHGMPPVSQATLADNNNANGVGGHSQHAVTLVTRSAAFACTTCHPDNTGNNLHANGGLPQMTFAASFATSTTWSNTSSNCTASYCHGDKPTATAAIYKTTVPPGAPVAGLNSVAQASWGGTPGRQQPVWTTVDGTYRACTACHGAPPALSASNPHPTNTTCADCHPSGSSATAMAGNAAITHVDGHLDLTHTGCTACHGDLTADLVGFASTLAMPGFNANAHDVAGNTAASFAAVGSHQKHLTGTTIKNVNGGRAAVCADCHSGYLPATNNDITHVTGTSLVGGQGSRGTVAFSNVARTGLSAGGTPLASTYTGSNTGTSGNTAGTCNSTYCHSGGWGAGSGYQGSNPNPRFTDAAMNCGSCHASPPTDAKHSSALGKACSVCHGANYSTCTVTTPGNFSACTTIANPALHINGSTDVTTTCQSCHGTPPTTIAQLADPQDNPTGIGAHADHVNGTNGIALGLGCAACHGVTPANYGHIDNLIMAGFTGVGSSNGFSPTPAGTTYTALWSRTPNCTNYCHSNALGVGVTVSWTSPTAMTCTSCHATTGAGGLSAKHGKHTDSTGYRYKCDECHAQTMAADSATTIGSTALHVNGTKDWKFAPTLLTTNINQSGGTYAGGTCTNTYCHSGGVSTTAGAFSATASAALQWSTGTSTCKSCHGGNLAGGAPTIGVALGSSFQGSAAHMNHVANASVIGTNYLCGDCHNTVVQAGTDATLISTTLHVNGTKNVAISPRPFGQTSSDTTNRCSNTYCHSSGQIHVAAPHFEPVGWTSTWSGVVCNKCHGAYTVADGANFGFTPSISGEPNYKNGGPSTTTANSHQTHAASYTCAVCHSGFVNTAETGVLGNTHTDGYVNVLLSTTVAGTGAAYTYGSGVAGSCQASKCHGASTVFWGGAALDCSGCHGKATGAAVNDGLDDYVYGNGTPSVIDLDLWNTYGHGRMTASGVYPESGNPAAGFDAAVAVSTNDGCNYCHNKLIGHGDANNPFRLANIGTGNTATDKNGVCTVCHGGAGYTPPGGTLKQASAATNGSTASHFGTLHTATYGGQLCWDCHDPHGSYNFTANAQLGFMIRERPIQTHADATGAANWGSYQTATLALAPDFRKANGSTAAAYDWGDYVLSTTALQPFRGICQVCHTSTSVFRQGTFSNHNAPAICTSCHMHAQGTTDAFKPNGDCTGCHDKNQNSPVAQGLNAAVTSRRNIVREFTSTWSHKRTAGGTVSKWDCIVCHMEGDPATGDTLEGAGKPHKNGYIELRDPDSGTTIMAVTPPAANSSAGYTVSTTTAVRFVRWSRNLSSNVIEPEVAAVMLNQCLKCHDGNGAQAYTGGRALQVMLPNMPAGTIPQKPFGQSISGAGYNGGTGLTACASGTNGCVVNVDASFVTTNASYHPIKGRQNNSYIATTRLQAPWNGMAKTAATTTSWGYLISCWDCHAPNRALGPQTFTVTAHGGYQTIRQDVWISSATGSGAVGAGNLCRTCHNTAASNSHGAGSAFSGGGNSGPGGYIANRCYYCHSSNITATTGPGRPLRAQDVHGFDEFTTAAAQGKAWPTGATDTWKPYAFFRSVGTAGAWSTAGTNWKPLSGTLSGMTVPTGGATCSAPNAGTSTGNLSINAGCSAQNHGPYTPGGVF